ncbi:MAG: nucleotide pyrophosphohydrolase [Gammaproteobacteria bacterium]|nr:nucleotide pyrophosphohydrolase [Gammaproteobacteria bacterium]
MDENKIEKLFRIISELRDPISGCEWTKSQTSKTLLPFIIEEAKEVLDAFEKDDNENLKEELGDLLLQIILQSKIAEENKLFSFNEVIDNLCEKLIRRHPYVFEDKRPHTIEEQRKAYFKIKEFEKSK